MNADGSKLRLTGPLTVADKPWLIALGVTWPNQDTLGAWLADLNALAAAGSASAHHSVETVQARQDFLALLRVLDPNCRAAYTRDTPWGTRTDVLIASVRTLHSLGIDLVRQLNVWFEAVVSTPERILEFARLFSRYGIDISHLAYALPVVFSYSVESLTAKIEHIKSLGLDPMRVINRCARVLTCTSAALSSRIDLLTGYGLDAAAMVDKCPTLLGHGESAVRERLNVLYAAARSWGIERAEANAVIEGWPMVLGYKADRLRTLVRLLSHAVREPAREALRASHISQLGAFNLDHVLAGYFTHQHEIRHRNDLRFYAKRSQALGKAEARKVIAANSDHPILKFYWRSYPRIEALV